MALSAWLLFDPTSAPVALLCPSGGCRLKNASSMYRHTLRFIPYTHHLTPAFRVNDLSEGARVNVYCTPQAQVIVSLNFINLFVVL